MGLFKQTRRPCRLCDEPKTINKKIKGRKMKSELNRTLVEGLNESSNKTFLDNVNNLVYNLISSAVENISQKSPFVTPQKCVLIPVNEIYTGAFTQLSEFDYFLGIDNPQIEMNTKTQKNFWKYIWKEFKASWRVGRKKYKKRKHEKEQETLPQTIEKYQLSHFRHDVVNAVADFLSQSSIIYEYGRHFAMVGNEDFGTNVKINVYVASFDSKEETFKLYTAKRNKFTLVNFGSRFENLEYKTEACGNAFTDMIKIINSLYSKHYNRVPNQILVESLLFRCPNNLFDQKDVFKTFINVANYIRISSPTTFSSICNLDKTIFEEKLITDAGEQVQYSKIIKMLDTFKY